MAVAGNFKKAYCVLQNQMHALHGELISHSKSRKKKEKMSSFSNA